MLLGLAVASLAALLDAALRTARWRRRAPPLPTPARGTTVPSTVALLPVRDEAANVGPCLDALLAQTAPLTAVVIDDGSTDDTAARARRAAVRLVTAPPPPRGWRGKVSALAAGAASTSEPWLLLIDADARPTPDALAKAHAGAAARGLDALSLAGRPVALGLGENLLVPAVFAVLDFLLGDWAAAAAAGPAVASGQFVLVRRAALEAIGGFAVIRDATIDDVALVRALRAGGFRTGFWRAPDLLAARMYHGWRQAERGWRRNLAAIFTGRPGASAASLLVAAGPVLLAAVAGWRRQALPVLVVWVGGVTASAIFRASGGSRPLFALLYPLDALALAWTLARATVDRWRGRLPPWKGRDVRL